MALTRKHLKSMGLTEEQVDAIIDLHLEVKNGLDEQIKKYKADADQLQVVQKELDDLKKSNGGEDYKAKYEQEKKDHAQTKADYAAKETAAANERLFRAELTAVGITGKRADQIVKLTDLSQFETENGAYKDAKAVQDHIRTEYSELVPAKTTKGATVATPPGNTGGKMTKEQIMAIKDSTARRAAIAQNMDLFKNM